MMSVNKEILNDEVMLKRLKSAKKWIANRDKKEKDYSDRWDTETFIKKTRPFDYKQVLKTMEENAQKLQIQRSCMGCDKTDIGRLGTLYEMCDDCVTELAQDFGKVTILSGRLNIEKDLFGKSKEGRCLKCNKKSKRVFMVNIYLCQKCMRKVSHVH